MSNDEEPYDLYPAGTMNFDQYYEYRDKYCPSDEGLEKNDVPRSVLIDTASKLQILTTINKAKGVNCNPSTFESLESSVNTIDKEITNMLSQEGDHSVEDKLNLTKTNSTYKDDGKIRVAGLKGDVYLDDSFFELKLSEPQNVTSPRKEIDSPKESRSSEHSNHLPASKENSLLVQNNSDDDVYQRAIARYAEPTIGVPGQHNMPQFKTTINLNNYLDIALNKLQKESKSEVVPTDVTKNTIHYDATYNNTIKEIANIADEEGIKVSNHIKLGAKKSTKAKFYTPQELYKLKKEHNS